VSRASTAARVRRLIGKHRELDRRPVEPFELEPRIAATLLAAVALERLGVGALERGTHRRPALLLLDENKAPRLAVPDRRRTTGDLDQ
jgi:hypothetical protein